MKSHGKYQLLKEEHTRSQKRIKELMEYVDMLRKEKKAAYYEGYQKGREDQIITEERKRR
jgi:hypothetical protein